MNSELLLIGGDRTAAMSADQTDLIDPATGSPWITVACGGAADIDRAVQAAYRAEPGWRQINSRDRTRLLLRLTELIRQHQEPLAQLESRNVGKPIRDARDDVALTADCFEFYAGAINKTGGTVNPVAAAGTSLTLRQPVGVCGLIAPWNFPLLITAWKVAPALAMGNTVVLKPATLTPLSALRLGELALEAGIAPGVFNVVPGAGGVAGEALIRHPLVRKVSFTGSTEVGSQVMRLAADDIKRVTLELGGKSANLIFADADLEQAIPKTLWSVLGNAGQDCTARSRLLVERPLYEEVISRLEAAFRALKLGLPSGEETELGPLVSLPHRAQVQRYIDQGVQAGATLVCGGSPPQDGALQSGAFLQPTLFADVSPDMSVFREEIFGPVLCAMPFDREEEAIAIANHTPYGLSGSLWTRDISRALRVAKAIETGVISVNSGHSVHLEAPFGGFKRSGLGRELGLAVLDHYSELKSVFIGE